MGAPSPKRSIKITRGGQPVYVRQRTETKDGKEYGTWELSWREVGKPRSTSRANKEDALAFAGEIATRLAKGEIRQRVLTGTALLEYEQALAICEASKCSLLDAARLLKATKRPPERRTLDEVRTEFLDSKAKRSKRHVQSLASDTKSLTDKFGSRCILDLQLSDLTKWITSMKVGARAKQNRWSNNRTMFRWARENGYLPDIKTEIERVDAALWAPESREDWTEDDGFGEACLLTPAQLRNLFAALPERLIPVLALGAFAGIRRSEASRLHWRMVKEGHIEVPRLIARKKKKRRLAPYLPACSAWLEPCRQSNGLIIPYKDRFNQVIAIAKNIGIKPWPQNVLRHSFISYRLALTQNIAQVAQEAGTSAEKIESNYDEKATKKDAEAWFAVLPAETPGEAEAQP